MRTLVLLVLLGGCASQQVKDRDERDCRERGPNPGVWCSNYLRERDADRAAARAAEDAAAYEKRCYVVIEDPAATPQARGECRQLLAEKAAQREDASRNGAAVLNGILSRPAK